MTLRCELETKGHVCCWPLALRVGGEHRLTTMASWQTITAAAAQRPGSCCWPRTGCRTPRSLAGSGCRGRRSWAVHADAGVGTNGRAWILDAVAGGAIEPDLQWSTSCADEHPGPRTVMDLVAFLRVESVAAGQDQVGAQRSDLCQ
jgi:hypothetical protein